MAWYALYKWFIPWRKIPYTNWVNWYSNKLYDEWFEGLTDEQKERVLEYQRKKKEKREAEARQCLLFLEGMLTYLDDRTHGAVSMYRSLLDC